VIIIHQSNLQKRKYFFLFLSGVLFCAIVYVTSKYLTADAPTDIKEVPDEYVGIWATEDGASFIIVDKDRSFNYTKLQPTNPLELFGRVKALSETQLQVYTFFNLIFESFLIGKPYMVNEITYLPFDGKQFRKVNAEIAEFKRRLEIAKRK